MPAWLLLLLSCPNCRYGRSRPRPSQRHTPSTLKTRALQLPGAVQAAWRCCASEAIVQVPSMQNYRLLRLVAGRNKRWPLSRFAKLQLLGASSLKRCVNRGSSDGKQAGCMSGSQAASGMGRLTAPQNEPAYTCLCCGNICCCEVAIPAAAVLSALVWHCCSACADGRASLLLTCGNVLAAELGNMGGNKGTKLACGQHRLCAKFVAAADHPLGCALVCVRHCLADCGHCLLRRLRGSPV